VNGEPNLAMVVTYSALRRQTINIEDAYEAQGSTFPAPKKFSTPKPAIARARF